MCVQLWSLSGNVFNRKIIYHFTQKHKTFLITSVGTVLIFQFCPGFGTEALVPTVPWYRLWYLGSGSYFSVSGFGYQVFRE